MFYFLLGWRASSSIIYSSCSLSPSAALLKKKKYQQNSFIHFHFSEFKSDIKIYVLISSSFKSAPNFNNRNVNIYKYTKGDDMQHVKRYIDTLIFSDQGNWVKDHSKMLTVTFLSLQSVFYLFALITGRSSFMLSTFFFLLILAITFGFVSEIKHPVMQINLTVLSAETLIFSMFGSYLKDCLQDILVDALFGYSCN